MSVARAVRAMPAMFRIGFAELVAYRAEMVVWILSATMPLIMLALWNSVVAEAPIAGFGPTEITRYFAATLVVRQLTGAWLVWHLNWMIRTGGLSAKLLRPIKAKINLIPFNTFPQSDYQRPSGRAVSRFWQVLVDAGYIVTVRTTRGDDIDAACGQLVGQVVDRTRRSERYRAGGDTQAIEVM